ncbi:RDD family protein [Williamsia sterculiae]|uniref:RDD family protein n=1 Tax=Williamsia sterculiae TaxID=1344003 RepID=UPI000970D8E8|nr:RDD family protein [Williamsia sterculiae]
MVQDSAVNHPLISESICPIGRRAGAFVIDYVAAFAAVLVVGVVVAIADSLVPSSARYTWPISLVLIVLFVIWNLGLRQGHTGSSFGKQLIKASVVDAHTLLPVGRAKGLLRVFIHPVDLIFFRWSGVRRH